MQTTKFKPGDIFLTRNPMWLGHAINTVQWFWSKDGQSHYSHAGIIINSAGSTYEALWRVKKSHILTYAGKQDPVPVLIARHETMSPENFIQAFNKIRQQHDNDFYPFYRLVFHIFPPLAKLSIGRVVCSELVAKFLTYADIMDWFNGCNPDDLHDIIRIDQKFHIIYEGRL